MKKYLLLFGILFCVSINGQTIDLLSIYQKIPLDFIQNSETWLQKKYKFEFSSNRWSTKSLNENNIVYPIVDKNNGYLSIKDENISASFCNQFVEMALFTTKDNKVFVCYTTTADGYCDFAFFEYENNKFTNITNKKINVSFRDFFNSNYKFDEYSIKAFSNTMIIKLPQFGTNISFSLNLNAVNFYLDHDIPIDERNSIKSAIKNINIKSISMNWDQEKGIFKDIIKK